MVDTDFKILKNQHLLQFKSYEDYLESFITPRDLFHLRSKMLARRIIELGYHTTGTFERESFYKKVELIRRFLYLKNNPLSLCSESIKPKDNFLHELALREKANRYGKMYTIIFIRHCGKAQFQISGFIDYCHRLKTEDWLPYFDTSKKLKPKKTDLSFYNWKSRKSIYNNSANFKLIADGNRGLIFQNIHDSKLIMIHTYLAPESNPNRFIIHSNLYGRAILYDHHIIQIDKEEKE